MDEGDLEKAEAELKRALASPDNPDDVLVEIHKLQAIVAFSRGDKAEARKALERLFQVRPEYAVPKGASPKLRDLFAEVQADVRARRVKPVTLEFDPPSALAAGGPVLWKLSARDVSQGVRLRLLFRRAGSEAFGSLDFKHGEGELWTATLPGDELPLDEAPFALEFYLEAQDASGRRLAGRGDALSPLTARVRAPSTGAVAVGGATEPTPVDESSPWYTKWWLWTGVGVVAAGGAAVGIYLLTRDSTGTVPVTVTVQ